VRPPGIPVSAHFSRRRAEGADLAGFPSRILSLLRAREDTRALFGRFVSAPKIPFPGGFIRVRRRQVRVLHGHLAFRFAETGSIGLGGRHLVRVLKKPPRIPVFAYVVWSHANGAQLAGFSALDLRLYILHSRARRHFPRFVSAVKISFPGKKRPDWQRRVR
jgi:hypothetical protein